MPKEVKIVIERVLGAESVFRQGGSLRLILPKKAFAILDVSSRDVDDSDFSTVIMLSTNKGILLRPLKDYLYDGEMRE